MKAHTMANNIWKIYVYRILLGMIFSVPTIVLFWQNHGMNLTDVMTLQSLFALAMVLFELPSGYFADIAGRKTTLVLAAAGCLMAICIYSQGTCFTHFLTAEICFAFGFALISGADAALVYDTLQVLGRENEFQKIFGRLFFISLFSFGVSSIIGGFISAINIRWSFYATIPFFAAAVMVALALEEPPRQKLQAKTGYGSELIQILKYCFFENHRLCRLILFSGLVLGLNNAAVWFYQPYFAYAGLPIAWFGVAFASYQVVAAVCSAWAHRIEKKIGETYSLILLVLFVGSGYFLMANAVFLLSFTFAFCHQFARGYSRIVLTDYVNQLTTSDRRATVLSVQNLVMRLFYAMLLPFAGRIADTTSLVEALNILGIASLIIGGAMLGIMNRKKVLSSST